MKPEMVFTRRFSMGHRLIHSGSDVCALPHGHNEYVKVYLHPVQTVRLDGRANMIQAFSEAKSTWHRFVDTKIDHALQLSEDDPLLEWFFTHEPQRAQRIMVTPGDPTTELTACLLLAKLNAFLQANGNILACQKIMLEETPTNTVTYEGNPHDFLPLSDRAENERWWCRPDMSIADCKN
ncbi:6-pyruvoyl trahydropterin synthase family protein [Entomobacter blattae]|uniref:6-carboxy-5,6,7,8-tetrahydropterin synthase n=1 Tax=Entomobacter blattae TaxID=2762277 RepID=A0A7H1NQG1_9PROT|nr:6-carboxytetrahydropterin synthase [Entomobacter blattae]QNT78021.1 6-pyruvoyl tetrahydropterin synthase [Entomobacter blattae]